MKKKIHTISIIIFIVDLFIKQTVIHLMQLKTSINIIPNFFSLTYVRNDGAAFNLFSGNLVFLITVAIGLLFVINYLFIKDNNITKLDMYSYGLLIGGILGNLFDRIVFGYVVDYLDFNIINYNFPIFNLADIAICTGAFLMVINMVKEYKNENNKCR